MLPQRSGVVRRDPEGSERVRGRSKPRLFPVCAVPISAGGMLRLTSSSTGLTVVYNFTRKIPGVESRTNLGAIGINT